MGRKRGTKGRRTIRRQLTRIVLIPSISFLVLWTVMTATGTWQAATVLLSVAHGRDGTETLGALAAELREERRLSQVHLADPEADRPADALAEQRATTDTAVERAGALASSLRAGGNEEVRRGAAAFRDGWEALADLRARVDEAAIDRAAALDGYTALIEDIRLLVTTLLSGLDSGPGLSAVAPARELIAAREEFSRAEALLAGVVVAGGMSYQETAHFTYLTASYRDTLAEIEPDLRGEARRRYEDMVAQPSWTRTQKLSRSVVTRSPVRQDTGDGRAGWNSDLDVGATEWRRATHGAAPALDALVEAQLDLATDTAWTAALQRIGVGLAGCAVTLAAGIAAIVFASRSSRRLTGRLIRLRTDTLALSDTQLPAIVDRAQSGQRVDVSAELPGLDFGTDEIGEVADAFNTAQRTAVGAAVKQAEIREGANRVFLGIAYRNQTLVQRQLRLLDEIEYDENDPRTLNRLFRLDHLATRARRYADNLIILGGARSARRWRDPLPLADVLRAAISETEDYERVRLTSAPAARLRGSAVADIVHLLAELVENATQFSPSGSPVDVNCGTVAGGLAIDVEDRGLGMTEEGYAEAGRTLAEAPEFDVMALPDEPRLGLFVVARLAARHGVRVRLYPSPYGGTRATAVIPENLLEAGLPDDDTDPEPDGPVMVPDPHRARAPRSLEGNGER